ncbi:Uncharacterized protein HZ326_7403 [Fusarium oxysporum f. sp. albedinis]|nr:Uncharacterized protein HZ326_7403 [Fusarium oxysporum f. sp. albedinis]
MRRNPVNCRWNVKPVYSGISWLADPIIKCMLHVKDTKNPPRCLSSTVKSVCAPFRAPTLHFVSSNSIEDLRRYESFQKVIMNFN